MSGINDNATLVPAIGHYFFNPTIGAARPTDPTNPSGGWVDLGHTSLDSPFGLKSTGATQSTLGTWQNPSLRVSYTARVQSIDFELQQFTTTELALYYGSNGSVVAGRYREPVNPVPTTGALFVLIEDGEDQIGMYYPSVSIFRSGDIALDAAKLAGLPVTATILGVTAQNWLSEIDPIGELATLVSLAVSPATKTLAAAGTQQLSVIGTYSNGDTHDLTATATYVSGTPAHATVNSAGLVTAVATGTSVITATVGSVNGTMTVTCS